MVYSYPPFEEVADPHDRGDSKKQAAYEAAVKAKLARGDYIDSQFELRKTIGNATLQSKYYLAQMFPNEDDVAAILKNAKISDAVIKLLTHPLEDSVYPFKE